MSTKDDAKAAIKEGLKFRKLADEQAAKDREKLDELKRVNYDKWFSDKFCPQMTHEIARGMNYIVLDDYDQAQACERAGLRVYENEGNMSLGFRVSYTISWDLD